MTQALKPRPTTRKVRDAGRTLWRARTFALAMSATIAVGCSAKPLEIGKAPALSPVGAGIKPPPPTPVTYAVPDTVPQRSLAPHLSTSLWSNHGADLFRDRRARRLGDILTVTISIKDKATLDNRSKRSRDSSQGVGFDVAYDIKGIAKAAGAANGATALKSNTAQDGKGEIERSESIDLRLAAVVSKVLPNGNLLIQGSQEVRVNFELRELTFTGVVNIADIKADNTIPYERIAEARISYGGRGRSMEVQQPAWGHQILDLISPF